MNRFLFFALILAFCCNITFATEQQSANHSDLQKDQASGISEFKKKFQLRFLTNYNFVSFWSSEFHEGSLISNRPVDAGLGFGYGDLYLDILFALPFTLDNNRSKSLSFETGFDFFPSDWWIQGKYRRYSGFSVDSKNGPDFINLWEREAFISALWMATAKNKFTPRAAYFLDRKQEHSAGSMILGGRIQNRKTKDTDSTLAFYREERSISSGWVDMGYSYTWVYDNKMFINLWGVLGISVGSERSEESSNDFALLPEVITKMAFGQIRETWSWNSVLEAEYLPIIFDDHWEQRLVCTFKILAVRRF